MLFASSQMRTSTRLSSRLSLSVFAARASAAWRAARAACSPASRSRASPAPAASANARATSTSDAVNSRPSTSVSTSTWRADSRTRMGSNRAVCVVGSAPSARANASASAPVTRMAGSRVRRSWASEASSVSATRPSRGLPAGAIAAISSRPSSSATDSSTVLRARKKPRASSTSVSARALGPPASTAVPKRRETALIASPAPPKRGA
jgi:hypothetical protein